MKRRQFLHAALGAGALAGFAELSPAMASLTWARRSLLGFGTTLSLQAGHEDARTLERALDAAVHTLRRIESQMSLFDPASALSRLNREGELVSPPSELAEVLDIAHNVSRDHDGAFDVTVQPLWLAFAAAQREGRLPDRREVRDARAKVDWRAVQVSAQRISLDRPGMAVTLNGIAQGYAADRVRAVLASYGVGHALVDAGEFAPLSTNSLGRPWTLGIADPHAERALLARLMTDGRCVATSADNLTTFSEDHRHHHIFDPHTGYSPTELSAVTVVADSGALADALTKAFFVAGPSQARALAHRWKVDALWVDKAGRWEATPGLRIEKA
ncbi:Thiamine biosynthesis lipoprotein ApbE precursor [Variovorax sp. PBS-H4]|uniref:FAD:protein FMN transferase n=1 Tax=Variovorax sp. PBS-H4 TaxID=434008 RepID=UPI0013191420|nr:FAD:protein FMN transferase [Variovorax sp. PBS-H4]VTU28254.1 Thiamine biosynthesis lipoprotein ApbE precursor [Variovorax sp. PBS-H4]